MRTPIEIDLADFAQIFEEEMDHPGIKIEPIRNSDYRAIGTLDYLTIQNTAEAQGESEEELIEEMKSTFEGKYGVFIEEASFGLTFEGVFVSAIVIVLYPDGDDAMPLVANAMTHPDFQRRRFISALIRKSINALLALNYERVFFAIHPENHPSLSLAEKYIRQ